MIAEKSISFLIVMLLLYPGLAQSGSVYQNGYLPLTTDHSASKVGDLLTVLIYESASAAASANTNSSKSIGVSASVDSTHLNKFGKVDLSNNTEGAGTISRTGKLVASVSVVVDAVEKNGDMRISGNQRIDFNDETQLISIKGKVRKEDIKSDNTILSTRLADAEIVFIGDGLLGERQKPGIITRIFNWIF
ncbi:MAG: flagellar basal body L-ring protein FlgH [Candidatus Thiodiazotropha sp. (ex Dulcina madagascariensis)]|nr:flagellar basal body L-ring protein FlgH [Candidatus Thiodiazotropha sp. (ex Epidulcina cf. delphinae)]MCU7922540.1 flagellar basal body L-ring protein FlgH [Candidatus Thiodiazotropha sp. (ex Dulcina madagascariensis)]MCU7925833.1 flagellar basal body L-ring protein FlgH [Candidatus Thiodiazotropha sp. (ex Dulcina madagascariensis)]